MSAPLRVLMITTSFPRTPGDLAGHMVMSLARALAANENCRVTVLAPDEPGIVRREVIDGVHVHRLQYFWPRSWERLAYGAGILPNLRQRRRAWLNLPGFGLAYLAGILRHTADADLIHAHWGPLGALAAATRWLHHKPVVATIHGSDWKSKLASIRGLTGYAIGHATGVITLSDSFQADCLRLRHGRGPVPIIPHGVDSPPGDQLRALRESREPGRLHLVTVGRLIPERRHDLLVRAFAELRAANPGARLTIVGGGPQAEPLRALGDELALGDALAMPGMVATSDVPSYLMAADLYVSPTTVETFGLSVIEAAMHALPVLTTDVGFPSHLIGDCPAGGQVIPPADEAALTAAIARWAADPDALPAAGWAMRAHAKSLGLDWSRAASQTRAFYDECLAPAPSSPVCIEPQDR